MAQRDDILAYLQEGNTLTPLEALKKFGCFRLSGRIHELRQMKYKIKTDRLTVRKANGSTGNVARYRLEDE